MAFHQTTPLDPQTLREAVVQAASQEAAILAIFQRLRRAMTPSDVWAITQAAGKQWPMTSIRRAITDLTDERHALEKTGRLRVGMFGKPENFWQLASPAERTMPQACAINDTSPGKLGQSQPQQGEVEHGYFESGGGFGTGYCRA